MAVLNRLACIPSKEECSILSGIQGSFEIWQPKTVPGARPQELTLLNADLHSAVCIRSNYEDVQFKFECFYITVCQAPADQSICSDSKIGVVNACQQAKAVLRVEWERSALLGEVPLHYEQVIQVRGGLNDIPPGSPACVSMVGILLIDNGANQGLIYLDDDFPLSLSYTQDPKEIGWFLSQSSAVTVDEIAVIRTQLSDWRKVT